MSLRLLLAHCLCVECRVHHATDWRHGDLRMTDLLDRNAFTHPAVLTFDRLARLIEVY